MTFTRVPNQDIQVNLFFRSFAVFFLFSSSCRQNENTFDSVLFHV